MPTRVRLLGPMLVQVDGDWVRPPPQKTLCLLGYLAFAGDWVLRERLAVLFWPEADSAAARRNLRQLIQRVRRTGLADDLEVEPARVRWPVVSDLEAFRRSYASGDWVAAAGLYQGAALDGLPPPDCGGFEDWIALEREALRDAWRDATYRSAQVWNDRGEAGRAVETLQRLLDDDPLAEDVMQAFLRYAGAAGRRGMALRVFARFAQRLRDELGLDPLPETVALADALDRDPVDGLGGAPTDVPAVQVAWTGPKSGQVPDLVPSRLIDRERALHDIRAANGPLVWVVGEAGVGKSALLTAAAPGVRWVACREAWQGVAFGALTPLVRAYVDAAPETSGVRDDLAPLLPEALDDAADAALDASARARLLLALARMLEEDGGAGSGAALGLVVDDAQWADDGTLALIASLAERGKIRTLVGYREHEVSRGLQALIRRFEGASVVPLEPLDDDGVIAFLGSLMDGGGGPPLFGRWLKRVTGGNPMFMLETLRSLFEAGELRLENGRWHSRIDHVTRDYTELQVPTVVQDTVRRRLDRLGSGTERVVQALAVAGGRLSIDTLAAVSGVSVWVAADALEAAQQAGLLRPSALSGEDAADTFAHDLIRQAVYDGVPAPRKRLLHVRFAQAGSEGRPDARVAEHWLAAGEARSAREAFERAADELGRRGLHDDGLTLLERARALAESDTERDRIEGKRVRTLREAGRVDEALAAARALLGRDPASLEARAQAQDVLAMVAVMERDFEAARTASEAGLAAARASGDADMVRQLVSTQAVVAYESGGYDHALTLLEPLLKDHMAWRESGPGAFTLSNVAALYDILGRSEEALPLHLDALAIARRCGARREQVDIVTNLLYCCMELGTSDLGLVAAREALAFGRFEGTDGLRLNLARALLDLGRPEEALENYRLAAETAWDPSYRAVAWAQVASLEAAAGDEPRAALERALALAEASLSQIALARVAIVGARHASAQHHDALSNVIARVDAAGLPEYLRTEFEHATQASDGS